MTTYNLVQFVFGQNFNVPAKYLTIFKVNRPKDCTIIKESIQWLEYYMLKNKKKIKTFKLFELSVVVCVCVFYSIRV